MVTSPSTNVPIGNKPTADKPSDNKPSNSGNSQNSGASVKSATVVGISTSLNVRKGAGTNYSVITYLTNNTGVEVLSEVGSWYKIRLKNGTEGYCAKQYIKINASSSSSTQKPSNDVKSVKGKVINVSTNLNVRSGPGTQYSVRAYLLGNTQVIIKNNTNGWYQIEVKVNGTVKSGYVKSDYIEILK